MKRKRFSDIGPTEKQQEKARAQHQEHVADMRDRVHRLVDYEQCYECLHPLLALRIRSENIKLKIIYDYNILSFIFKFMILLILGGDSNNK